MKEIQVLSRTLRRRRKWYTNRSCQWPKAISSESIYTRYWEGLQTDSAALNGHTLRRKVLRKVVEKITGILISRDVRVSFFFAQAVP